MIKNNSLKNLSKKGMESLQPIYLLTGENSWKIEKSISNLKLRFGNISERELNFQQFDLLESTVDDVSGVCNILPFLSSKRLVIARNVHRLNNDELENIIEYAKSPSPYTCLVLVAETVWDDSDLPGSTKEIRATLKETVKKTGEIYNFKPIQYRNLESWVRERCREREVRINPAAVYLLTNFLGNDLFNLESEIEKLTLYVGKGNVIDQATIQVLVSGNPEISIFKFLDALGEKKGSEAYKTLKNIYLNTKLPNNIESLRILGIIRWHFKKLLEIKSLIKKKINLKEMSKILSLRDFAIKKLINQHKNFSGEQLKNCLLNLLEVDEGIKTGKQKSEILIEKLVSKIVNI